MSTLYEIVELEDGEIALQKADEKGEPLVRIRFSEESLYYLNDAKLDVAKAMIEAGLEAASELQDEMAAVTDAEKSGEGMILH
ncbi:hypothetical protein [Teredinibacter haidensis]|uniref:hypothetical protein n=1 Tax=Teredinibacter haidensis TaxID=2731755 RepID=UPI000948D886|nr:hypothetical protein [Teredinibacter haidensis]